MRPREQADAAGDVPRAVQGVERRGPQHRFHAALAIVEIRLQQRRRLARIHAGIIEIKLGHGGMRYLLGRAARNRNLGGNQVTPRRSRKRPGWGSSTVRRSPSRGVRKAASAPPSSEERRGGKEGASTWKTRG